MKLKGGCAVHSVRWAFVGVCLCLFALNIALMILAAVNYGEMRYAFDELQSQRDYTYRTNDLFPESFRPEAALAIFYFGMAVGSVFAVISLIGLCGAVCLDPCFLLTYAVTLSVVLFGSIIGLAASYHAISAVASSVYRGFIQHLYGRQDMLAYMFAKGIDTVQKTHKCCGVLDNDDYEATVKEVGASPTYYSLLFWLESTQWGQIQANAIGYDDNKALLWAPDSCCVNSEPNCALGLYGDRYQWDEAKERNWSGRIYTIGCGKYMLRFDQLSADNRNKLMIITIIMMCFLITTIVLACWLCQTLKVYENSSRDSELDQKRHRGRRFRHRRQHKMHQLEHLDTAEEHQTGQTGQTGQTDAPANPGLSDGSPAPGTDSPPNGVGVAQQAKVTAVQRPASDQQLNPTSGQQSKLATGQPSNLSSSKQPTLPPGQQPNLTPSLKVTIGQQQQLAVSPVTATIPRPETSGQQEKPRPNQSSKSISAKTAESASNVTPKSLRQTAATSLAKSFPSGPELSQQSSAAAKTNQNNKNAWPTKTVSGKSSNSTVNSKVTAKVISDLLVKTLNKVTPTTKLSA